MKLLWSSNAPWTSSGYGNQTAITVPRLQADGHEVAISCFFGLEGGCIDWNGITCLPTDVTRFGSLMLPEYAKWLGGGDPSEVTVITLQDVWVLLQNIQNIQALRVACWLPIDHDPPPPKVLAFVEQAGARVLPMSRFGQKALEDRGFDASMYVPHMVDTTVFKPDPEHKAEYRDSLKLPRDAFVVGMVAANQGLPSRKSFPQVFEAFAEFRRRHNDAMIYLHTDIFGHNQGVNLVELAQACGIPREAFAHSDQLMLHLGIPQEVLPGVFNAFDVLAMPSFGEGFGIPLIEAQSCGVPVITSDFTAMTELCGAGWTVEGDRWWDQTQNSFQIVPSVGSILETLEEAYNHAESMGGAARDFALAYDTEKVWQENWKPALAELERPREVPPLRIAA